MKLDRDFISGIVEKLPPTQFKKDGQYHGSARSFRLVAIDPKGRRFIVSCEVTGEFRAPIAKALGKSGAMPKNDATDTPGWRSFAFDVRASVKVEPGRDGAPKFAVDVDEVKQRARWRAGVFAKMLGKVFDEAVTKLADGRAATMSGKLNDKMLKQVEAFKKYGVFQEIEYAADGIVLRFDVTRLKSDGIAGYVYAEPAPGTVPFHRYKRPRWGDHFYTTDGSISSQTGYIYEKVACHVLDHPAPGTLPLEHWRRPAKVTTSPTPTPRPSPGWVIIPSPSPATFTPSRRKVPSRSIGSSTRAMGFTFIQLIPMRSLRNNY